MILDRFFAGNQFTVAMLKAHAFEALLDNDQFLIAVKDIEGNHLLVSQSHLDAFGLSAIEEINDIDATPGWTKAMRDEWARNDRKVIESGKVHTFIESVTQKPKEPIGKDNPVIKHASRKIPVLDLFGRCIKYALFFSLTTGQKVNGCFLR